MPPAFTFSSGSSCCADSDRARDEDQLLLERAYPVGPLRHRQILISPCVATYVIVGFFGTTLTTRFRELGTSFGTSRLENAGAGASAPALTCCFDGGGGRI